MPHEDKPLYGPEHMAHEVALMAGQAAQDAISHSRRAAEAALSPADAAALVAKAACDAWLAARAAFSAAAEAGPTAR